jgi:hypothetical protein
MSLRALFRRPMGIFDEYRALCFTHPKAMNFYMMYIGVFFIMFYGKGCEKMVMHGRQTNYEFARRARRLFMPYLALNYKWAFPVNK